MEGEQGVEGFEVGDHDRGGRGSSRPNDSRGSGTDRKRFPSKKDGVTVDEVKDRR